MAAKGNIVVDNKRGTYGIILAMTKDSKRANVYQYGPDEAKWMPVSFFTVETSGMATCGKCGGSGQYHSGGMVLNGRFTGQTGICFACKGKGEQDNDDRLRNHYYWHRQMEIADNIEALERGENAVPLTVGGAPAPTYTEPTTRPLREVVAARRAKPAAKSRPVIRGRRSHSGGAVPAAPALSESSDDARLIDCKGCGTLHRDDTICPW